MKILCISSDPFPAGFGLTVFTKNFCKGMLKHDAELKLISYCYQEKFKAGEHFSFEGIEIIYAAGNKRNNVFTRLVATFRTVFYVWKMLFKKEVDLIFFFVFGWYKIILKILIPPFCKSFSFHGEYPQAGHQISGITNKLLNAFDVHLTDRFMTGGIFSSQNLIDFYSKYFSKKAIFINTPLLIDCDRFKNFPVTEDNNYISYCGDFAGNKDGVPDLLKAFSLIADDFPHINLKLIGTSSNQQDLIKLKNFISEKELVNRVVFTGKLSHDEMPVHLGNSRILALARPNNRQAHGGFPSKLGEYLATGVPVVVTRVGVIDQFFEDEKHLFFAEPDNPENFAERMRYVLSNREVAEKIARNGQKCACENFDYTLQTQKILCCIKGQQ